MRAAAAARTAARRAACAATRASSRRASCRASRAASPPSCAVHRPASIDIPAPDMATNEQTMAWMMDTYSMQKGYAVPGDRHRQADLDRRLGLPARGDRRRRRDGDRARLRRGSAGTLAEQRCVVQGFGNVGGIAATELHERGATVIAVSDISGGVYAAERPRRPDAARVRRASTARSRATREASSGSSNAELLELECDILVLAAREDQVTARTPGNVRCRLVAEGANGPTSIGGDAILAARGIPVLPDILTNAGGRHRLVLRVGAGPRPALLGPRRDPPASGRQDVDAFDRVWDVVARARHLAARRGARRRHPRSRPPRSRRAGVYP